MFLSRCTLNRDPLDPFDRRTVAIRPTCGLCSSTDVLGVLRLF